MNKCIYIKPEVEIISLPEPLMLELPVSEAIVDEEAAKQNFNDGDWEEEPFPTFSND